jgi:hypothetical protein
MKTGMDRFNDALDALRKRGAKGVSIFARPGATRHAVAADAAMMMGMMDRAHTTPMVDAKCASDGFLERG